MSYFVAAREKTMLSQSVEYALRAVVHLASRDPDPLTTDAIAQATLVPKAYLAKVLQQLVRGGVVRSQRGLGGGMTLGKSPEVLTILEIVNAVDPLQRIATCPLGLRSHGKICARCTASWTTRWPKWSPRSAPRPSRTC